MNMIEFLEHMEEHLTRQIKDKQLERREIRAAIMRLKADQLIPVPEKADVPFRSHKSSRGIMEFPGCACPPGPRHLSDCDLSF